MSVTPLAASIAAAPTPTDLSGSLAGKSSGGSKFADLLSALAGGDAQSNASAAREEGVSQAQDATTAADSTESSGSGAIDAGLAKLLSSAAASSVSTASASSASRRAAVAAVVISLSRNAGSGSLALFGLADGTLSTASASSASSTSARTSASSRRSDSTSDANDATAANLTLSALAGSAAAVGFAAFATPTTSDGATPATAAVVADAATPASLTAAAGLADASDDSAASGAVSDPSENESDASLGVMATLSRTFLAVDNASQAEAKSPTTRSAARAAATASASSSSAVSSAVSAAVAATSTSSESAASKHGDARGDDSSSFAQQSSAATSTVASSDIAAAIGAGATSLGPITTDQLGDALAAAAADLTAQANGATSASGSTSAATSGGDAVKELEVELDPPDLGSVSVKMRLAQGKLSVVVEVANSSALKAIQGDRDAIADRLDADSQPLESLIIKSAASDQTTTGTNYAQDANSDSQGDLPSGSNGSFQENGRQSARRDDGSSSWSRQSSSYGSGRGFSDLLV